MSIGRALLSPITSPIRALDAGLGMGVGRPGAYSRMPLINTATVLGGLGGAALGVAGGEEVPTAGAAAVGAAAGTVGLPLMGAAAGVATTGAMGLARNADNIAQGVGGAAGAAIRGTGHLAAGAVRGVNIPGGSTRIGQAAAGYGSAALSPTRRWAGALDRLSESVVELNPRGTRVNRAGETVRAKRVRTKPLGHGILLGAGIIGGIGAARRQFEVSRMGAVDPYMTTATPQLPRMHDDAGASGDLVFALNQNRRG